MTLPTGQFWCWRDQNFGIQVWSSTITHPRFSTDEGESKEPDWVFKKKHGVAPLPREALLLNNRCWRPHCPECGKELRITDIGCQEHGQLFHCASASDYWDKRVWHARIVTRKPLEDKP